MTPYKRCSAQVHGADVFTVGLLDPMHHERLTRQQALELRDALDDALNTSLAEIEARHCRAIKAAAANPHPGASVTADEAAEIRKAGEAMDGLD